MDVNAGKHGKYFARTSIRRSISGNLRSLDVDRPQVGLASGPFGQLTWDFPVVGEQTVYLTGHDELHSLSKNINANSIRFWMGFSDHYINVFNVLRISVSYQKRPCAPPKASKSSRLKSSSCFTRSLVSGAELHGLYLHRESHKSKKNGSTKRSYLQQLRSCRLLQRSGVPGNLLYGRRTACRRGDPGRQGIWNPKTMVNVEELDPEPLLKLLDGIGLPTKVLGPHAGETTG